MNDMFWEIPRHEALSALNWALDRVQSSHRCESLWFSLAKGGGRKILIGLVNVREGVFIRYRQMM